MGFSGDDDETVASSTPIASPPPRLGGRLIVPQAFEPGQLLSGRFRIVRFIADGGMGEVYEAEDTELSGRVALKTIRHEIAEDAGILERFKREVHLARQVTHPNVCRIYDVFRHEDTTFLAMELLPGETLSARLEREKRLSPDAALRIVVQSAAGLAAAHRAGVVHRDFKSANVMLVPDANEPGGTRAVVTDFGLARRHQGGGRDSGAATVTSAITGTPSYMAPEQVEGGPITPATDVYALGVVMYEMVTGTLPFQGETPLSIAVKRLKEAPPPPRRRFHGVPALWERTILRCLEREPANRYQSASDVPAALEGGRVGASPRTRRRRLLAAALAVLVAAAVAGALLLRGRIASGGAAPNPAASSAGARRSVAVLGFRNLSARPEVAWVSTALSEMLTTDLAAGEKLRTVSGESVARMKRDLALPDADSYAKDTLSRIRTNVDAGFVIVGSYLAVAGAPIRVDLKVQDAAAGETIAAVTESGTEAELAELVGRAGAKIRERLGAGALTSGEAAVVKASLPSNADAARLYAEGLQKLRSFDNIGARGLFQKALEADPQNALAHAALASAWRALGYDANAKAAGQKAFELSTNLSREERLSIEGQLRVAAKEWGRAIEIYGNLLRLFPDNLDYGLALADAQTWGARGRDAIATVASLRRRPAPAGEDPRIDLAEAIAYGPSGLGEFPKSVAAAERAAGKALGMGARLLHAEARYWQGRSLANLGEISKGQAALEDARREFEQLGDRGGVGLALSMIGWCQLSSGEMEATERTVEETLRIQREIEDRHGLADTLFYLAELRQSQGRLTDARSALADALNLYRETGDKPGIAASIGLDGEILIQQGRYAEALERTGESVALMREAHGDYAYPALSRASVLRQLGRLNDAARALEEGIKNADEVKDTRMTVRGLQIRAGLRADAADFPGAHQAFRAALAARGGPASTENEAAWDGLGEAFISIEEGRLDEVERAAREAGALFEKQKSQSDLAQASTLLGEALLRQKRLPDAQRASAVALRAAREAANWGVEFDAHVLDARITAAQGDGTTALRKLEPVLQGARERGCLPCELDAGLAGAEAEIAGGKTAAGRARLDALEKEATAKGFLLLARKARETREKR